jgi:hypothetical protein
MPALLQYRQIERGNIRALDFTLPTSALVATLFC